MENTKEIMILKDIASQLIPGCRMLLFGSRVKNEVNKDSDYDIILVTSENLDIQTKMQCKAYFRKMAVRHGLITDVFIESDEEMKTKSTLFGHIVRTAVREGIYV